jgi:hypothetical protein
MIEWISFDEAHPKRGKSILIKLRDGRVLEGQYWHTELLFDDILSGKLKESAWETQLEATEWRYQ